MDTSDAFLEAICLEPDADVHRLVFADWLEERGDADRAEFIRVQCELATTTWRPACDHRYRPPTTPPLPKPKCPGCRHDRRLEALRRRERELLRAGGRDWVPRLEGWDKIHVWDDEPKVTAGPYYAAQECAVFTFRRGFVGQVALTCKAFAGGPCDACRGTRFAAGMRALGPCTFCRGTGHTEGVAGGLFSRAAPVREVVLSDRQPSQSYGKLCWFWGLDRRPDVIPKELWDLLPGKEVWEFRGRPVEGVQETGYATRQAALDALSAACVAFGRGAAGFPALTPAPAAAP